MFQEEKDVIFAASSLLPSYIKNGSSVVIIEIFTGKKLLRYKKNDALFSQTFSI